MEATDVTACEHGPLDKGDGYCLACDLVGGHERLVEVLRYLADLCNHVCDDPNVDDWESHLHEPTTGGHRYCGPCVAWRVLNGSAVDAV